VESEDVFTELEEVLKSNMSIKTKWYKIKTSPTFEMISWWILSKTEVCMSQNNVQCLHYTLTCSICSLIMMCKCTSFSISRHSADNFARHYEFFLISICVNLNAQTSKKK
jgi:hypothetical protein